MNIVSVITSVVAAATLGVLIDWLLKSRLPEKPKLTHAIAGLAACIVLVLLAAWPSLTSTSVASAPTVAAPANSPTAQPTQTAVVILITTTPTPLTVAISTSKPIASPTTTQTATNPATPTLSCATVVGTFAAVWSQVENKIGCAQGSEISGLIVEENFQFGKMFWREPIDYAQALVVFSNGTWKIYQHAPFVEGSPDFPCADANTLALSPPTPKRGFGAMWCDIPAIRNGLGNATDAEKGFTGYMQQFDKGFMVQTDYGTNFVFYSNGAWEAK